MKKHILMRRTTFAAFAIAVVAAAWGAKKSHDAALARNLSIFNTLVRELEANYVDTIRTDETFKAAISALLDEVDPYTEFYYPDEQESLLTMTTGEYGGIGSYIMERDGWTYISQPYEGSPAAEAGLKAGDKLIRIDTVPLAGKTNKEVSAMLKGQPGTTVNVRVQRPFATDSILDFAIQRRKLTMPSVAYSGVTPEGIGYLKVTSFMDKSPDEVRKALEEFKKNPDLKGIALDLRGNGGGLLESAVDIAGMFLPKGTEVVRTKGKKREKIYKTTRQPIFPDIPLAVLIDGGSASASEIVAGSLQDLDRAVLVGSRSFGKGLVQSTRPLPYGSLLKVTVSKYYIPSGRLIQALDYSHRNPDGTVARTPDSLTHEYKTLHGRSVRDGGGLQPEVEVDWGKLSRIVYNVATGNWAFDFATKYAAGHETVPSPAEFTVTDTIFADFKRSIDPAKFKYDQVGAELMKKVEENLDVEGYLNPEVKAAIDSLSAMLTHDLDHDLDLHRSELSDLIASEIMSRYYFERGNVENSLKSDKGLAKATELLLDRKRYDKLLRPAR